MGLRKALIQVLFAGFGLGGWLTVNSVYVQLPALVDTCAEGWSLASYLALLVQLGNLGPLACRLLPLTKEVVVLSAMCLNSVALLPVAFFHDRQVVLGSHSSSLPLFVSFFLLSLACCTFSVLSWPCLDRYPPDTLIPFLVGEGLSNLIPGLLALTRGPGSDPPCGNSTSSQTPETASYNFSITVFFLIIFIFMCMSTFAFCVLTKYRALFNFDEREVESLADQTGKREVTGRFWWERRVFLPVVLAVLTAFANGALPSIQSYSSRPYGKLAYALSVNLSYLANPLACLLSYFIPVTSSLCFFPGLFLSFFFMAYVTAVAALSPSPPLQGSKNGVAVNVVAWICCTGFVSASKLAIAAKLRKDGKKGMFIYGVTTQIGSSVGAIIMFLLTNYTNIFQAFNPC